MKRFVIFLFAAALMLGADSFARGQSGSDIQVIDLSAKKYEFTPGEIHVKKGTHVQIRLHPTDKAHGLKLKAYPDGEKESGSLGLKFNGDSSIKVEKGEVGTIDFVAERPGTYSFECAKFCGFGHGGMKGKLVVED